MGISFVAPKKKKCLNYLKIFSLLKCQYIIYIIIIFVSVNLEQILLIDHQNHVCQMLTSFKREST